MSRARLLAAVAAALALAAVVAAFAARPADPAPAARPAAEALRIDGEVYAQRSAQLMPPPVDRVWQFNITRLADDGAQVQEGEPVVAFDSSELVRQLGDTRSKRDAKQRELENLDLDLAERARTSALATAEAKAAMEKAQRKTGQPRELIAALEYGKLVEERRRTERRAALAQRREQLAAVQRREERRLVASELAQLEADAARLEASIAAMDLAAPRSGVMMHRSSWSGDKFDVGSQVWLGQTVAEIPDTTTLAVRAELPERELLRVAVGAPVRIVVEGGGGSVHRGRVAAIGHAVRSRSQVQPIPVLDLEIALDDPGAKLRPGQSVRAELAAAGAAP